MADSRSPFSDVKEGDVVYVDVAARKKRTPLLIAAVVVVLAIVAILVIPQFMGTSATMTSPNTTQTMGQSAPAATQNQITVTMVIDGTDGGRGVFFDGKVVVEDGASVFDALKATKLDIRSRQAFGMGAYVSAIKGLEEKSAGPSSGWLYYVNDKKSSQSCDKVLLHEGDSVRWVWKVDALSVKD